MTVYSDRSLWFDRNLERVCIVDGVIPSVVLDLGYRVTYIGDTRGKSVTTEYANEFFISLHEFLKVGSKWVNSNQKVTVSTKPVGSIVGIRYDYGYEQNVELVHLVHNFSPDVEKYFNIGDCYTYACGDGSKLLKLIDIGKNNLILNYNGYDDNFVMPISEGMVQLIKVDLSKMIIANDLMVDDNGNYITVLEYNENDNTVNVIHHGGSSGDMESKHTGYYILSKYKKADKRLFLNTGELWGNRDNQYWVDSVYKDTNTKEILYVHCKLVKKTSKIVVLTADDFFNNHNKLDLHKILKCDALFYRNGVENEGCIVNDYTINCGVDGIPVHEITFNTFNRYKSNEISPEKHVTGDLYSFFEIYELRFV